TEFARSAVADDSEIMNGSKRCGRVANHPSSTQRDSPEAAQRSRSPATPPWGEGRASAAPWRADCSGVFSAQRRVHLLPKGEGRGGKRRDSQPACRTNLSLVELEE